MALIGSVVGQEVFATQAWPAGSKSIGPLSIGNRFRWGFFIIDLTALTDVTSHIQIVMELSLDNGATWQPSGGWGLDLPNSGLSLVGGVLTDVGGNPYRTSWSSMRLADPAGTLRKIRATASLSTPAAVGCTYVMW